MRSATDHDLVWNHASQQHCSSNHLSYYVIQKYYNFWEKFNQLFIRVCQSFPHLDAQFNFAPQTYNQYTPLSIDLCTQLGTHSLHQIGYIFCVPNWVHILCTKLGTYFLYPIGCMFCVPNLVPLSMIPLSKAPTYKAQFGVEIVYQIGYSKGCTQLGTVFHIPAIFSRLIGILRP